MKLSKILDAIKPFANVAAQFIPGAPAVISAVNAFLPDSKKLPAQATGGEILSAVEGLPPDQRASLMEKEIDLQIEQERGWTERYTAMAQADGHSTRPKIAWLMAQLLVGQSIIFMALLGWGVYSTGIKSLSEPYLWATFGTLTGIPAGLLGKYFGELRREQANRQGQPTGLLSGIMGLLKK